MCHRLYGQQSSSSSQSGRVGLALERLRVEHRRAAQTVVRVTAHVDVELPALGLCADAQVLQSAANDAHPVTLEVGQRDENVGSRYRLGDVRLLEEVALRDVDPEVGGAEPAVRADERAAQCARVKAVALSSRQYVQLARAGAVWRVRGRRRVAHERAPSQLLDPVGQRPGVHRPEVRRVVPLAAVYLDGHHVVRLDHVSEIGGVEYSQHLRDKAGLGRLRMCVHPIDLGLVHIYLPMFLVLPYFALIAHEEYAPESDWAEISIEVLACQCNFAPLELFQSKRRAYPCALRHPQLPQTCP